MNGSRSRRRGFLLNAEVEDRGTEVHCITLCSSPILNNHGNALVHPFDAVDQNILCVAIRSWQRTVVYALRVKSVGFQKNLCYDPSDSTSKIDAPVWPLSHFSFYF